jgi:hypothetical protein
VGIVVGADAGTGNLVGIMVGSTVGRQSVGAGEDLVGGVVATRYPGRGITDIMSKILGTAAGRGYP